MKNWRDKVDPIIKNHLEAQVKQTLQHKDAYNQAKDKGKAQLWVAVSNLSKQIVSLEIKTKYLENVLKDIVTNIKELKEQKPIVIQEPITKPKKVTKKKTKKKSKKKR